jgi:hypothetical protein
MGVGVQRHASAASPQGKTRYPLYRRLGGPQGRSGRLQKRVLEIERNFVQDVIMRIGQEIIAF